MLGLERESGDDLSYNPNLRLFVGLLASIESGIRVFQALPTIYQPSCSLQLAQLDRIDPSHYDPASGWPTPSIKVFAFFRLVFADSLKML